jgi:hypothetical protein
MPVTSIRVDPEMRCVPGRRRFVPRETEPSEIADADSRGTYKSTPDHVIKSLRASQFATAAAKPDLGQRQPRAFPIGSSRPPRLRPWEVFQRGPMSAPARTLPPRPASKNLHLCGR